MYDLLIIGGGPAGISAGVYASRKQLKTLFVTSEWGGQSTVSPDIQNWIGTAHISGDQLAKDLENHLKEYAGTFVEIKAKTLVQSVTKAQDGFVATLSDGTQAEVKTVLIATGSQRRRKTMRKAMTFKLYREASGMMMISTS